MASATVTPKMTQGRLSGTKSFRPLTPQPNFPEKKESSAIRPFARTTISSSIPSPPTTESGASRDRTENLRYALILASKEVHSARETDWQLTKHQRATFASQLASIEEMFFVSAKQTWCRNLHVAPRLVRIQMTEESMPVPRR